MRTEHFGYSPEDIGKNEDDYDYDRTNTPGPMTWTVIEKRNDQALDTFSTRRKAFLWVWIHGFWRFALEEGSATPYRSAPARPTPKQYTLMVLGVLALALASFLIVVTYPAFVTCAGMGGVLGAIIFGVALIRISTTSNKIRG